MDIYKPDQWHDFFLLVGTGAAALTGLVFVAMSINLKAIVRDPTHGYRAMILVGGFAAVFIRCGLVLMGGQTHFAVGAELLTVCVMMTLLTLGAYWRAAGTKLGSAEIQSLPNRRWLRHACSLRWSGQPY